MATLRELDRKGEMVTVVAAMQPATREAAIAAYAECHARDLKRTLWDLEATSEFKARDVSYQCAALAEIARRLTPEPPAKKSKRQNVVQMVAPVRNPRQQQIDLAAVLCPEERATLYLPTLDALKEEAETAILKNENVRHNQAMGSEVDEFMRFLLRVEDAARQARAALEQERRGAIPHDPRQVTSGPVRMQM